MSEIAHLNQLAAEVESGTLKLKVDRASLDAAIKGLQDLIDEIDRLGPTVNAVEHISGLGGFDMGVQLAQKFTRKAAAKTASRNGFGKCKRISGWHRRSS